MHSTIKTIRTRLAALGTDESRKESLRFFEEEIHCHGVKTIPTRTIGREVYKALKNTDKTTVFALCEQLWKGGMLEETFIACDWSYAVRKEYTPEDIDVFARWVDQYVDNWASCDTLCNHSIGTLVEMYPHLIERLHAWSTSPNHWTKRAAAVSLIIPARNGLFLDDIFRIADTLLLDGDDMVQKGYGWMLKAASQAHQSEVYDYVVGKKAVMPRTAYRYALEKMPKDLRAAAMRKD
ncbi:MAG: DNA alkylation repair protein [Planctomycetaceae bacterium]|nr:DNA alkylation repair protein [Planctomycetaceae bacterium]